MRQNVSPSGAMTRRHFAMTSSFAVAGLLWPTRTIRSRFARFEASEPTLVEDLVAANRILADNGILDGFGHVSARLASAPDRFLMARDVAPALVVSDDVLEFDLDSNPIDARGRNVYRERFIHGEIYKARPDIMAVVHSHSPAVIPFSLSRTPLRPAFHMAAFVVDGVPVFDPSRVPGSHHVLITTANAGHALAQILGARGAVLILGHGAAVVGTTLPMAVGRSIYLEASAKIQTQAMALGGELTYLDTQAAHEASENNYARAWELWRRKALTDR